MRRSLKTLATCIFIGSFFISIGETTSAQNPAAHPVQRDRGGAPNAAPGAAPNAVQPPPAAHVPWWRDEKIKSGIQLTAAQSDTIQRIVDSSVPGQRVIYATLTDAQKAVDALLTQDKPDLFSSIVAMQQLEMARCNLSVSRDLMLLRMRQVLSPGQRQTLATIAPDVNFSPKRQ
jgi:Spy/CpxP family protein refolding chaperone